MEAVKRGAGESVARRRALEVVNASGPRSRAESDLSILRTPRGLVLLRVASRAACFYCVSSAAWFLPPSTNLPSPPPFLPASTHAQKAAGQALAKDDEAALQRALDALRRLELEEEAEAGREEAEADA